MVILCQSIEMLDHVIHIFIMKYKIYESTTLDCVIISLFLDISYFPVDCLYCMHAKSFQCDDIWHHGLKMNLFD